MAKVKLEVKGYTCNRCSHEWVPRGKRKPVVCPSCKSPYWNIPKKKDTTTKILPGCELLKQPCDETCTDYAVCIHCDEEDE